MKCVFLNSDVLIDTTKLHTQTATAVGLWLGNSTFNEEFFKPETRVVDEKAQRNLFWNFLQLFLSTEKAMAVLPSKVASLESEREESQSPIEPLPIYQQRDNYFS